MVFCIGIQLLVVLLSSILIQKLGEICCCIERCSLYDNMWDDGNALGPKEIHSYLTRVMYNRRNKFDPYWNALVLGGVKNGQKYLGTVDLWFSSY